MSEGGRSGYLNTKGAVEIPLEFDGAADFSEGLAAVEVGTLWGYIDKQSQWVISPRFEQAFVFVDGLALAKLRGQWVYIDKSGAIIRSNVWDGNH